jgi:hypothetical protein
MSIYHFDTLDGDERKLYKSLKDIANHYPDLKPGVLSYHIGKKNRTDLSQANLPEKLKKIQIRRIYIPEDHASIYQEDNTASDVFSGNFLAF